MNEKERIEKLEEVSRRLAQWSRDFPREVILPSTTEDKCDKELEAIEKLANELFPK